MIRPFLLISLAILAGCASGPRPASTPPVPQLLGLDKVMNKPIHAILANFGTPGLDVREGCARKLQYAGAACVLDLYLYPTTASAVPIVTYVEARTPTGQDFDRASCIAALARKDTPQAR